MQLGYCAVSSRIDARSQGSQSIVYNGILKWVKNLKSDYGTSVTQFHFSPLEIIHLAPDFTIAAKAGKSAASEVCENQT